VKTFKGKVAIVTGGASGVGRATALPPAGRGCAIALADIDPNGLESVEKEPFERAQSIPTDRMQRIFPVVVHRWIAKRWEEKSARHSGAPQGTR